MPRGAASAGEGWGAGQAVGSAWHYFGGMTTRHGGVGPLRLACPRPCSAPSLSAGFQISYRRPGAARRHFRDIHPLPSGRAEAPGLIRALCLLCPPGLASAGVDYRQCTWALRVGRRVPALLGSLVSRRVDATPRHGAATAALKRLMFVVQHAGPRTSHDEDTI